MTSATQNMNDGNDNFSVFFTKLVQLFMARKRKEGN